MNPNLDRMCRLETIAEILQTLTPKQLVVVALRWDGMNQPEIAQAIGLQTGHISERLRCARKAIVEAFPQYQRYLEDTTRHNRYRQRPPSDHQLEAYHILQDLVAEGEDPTVNNVAARMNRKPQTMTCTITRLHNKGMVRRIKQPGTRTQLWLPIDEVDWSFDHHWR